MDTYDILFDLEAPLDCLCDGISAVQAFCLALEQENHALAGGLWAVWRYLNQQCTAVCDQYNASLNQLKAS